MCHCNLKRLVIEIVKPESSETERQFGNTCRI